MNGRYRRAGRTHYTLLVWAATILSTIVFHAKVVAHLVGDCRSHKTENVGMIGGHAAGKLVCAYRTFQCFAHDRTGECLASVKIMREILK